MHQVGDKDQDTRGDTIVNYVKHYIGDSIDGLVIQSFDYNVSQFLRLHDSDQLSRRRIANADKFIQFLDAKVHIDTADPKYSHVYQGIDTIVKRVVSELLNLDPFFVGLKLRRTGSSISGVKVGLPHESDYVLEIPRDRLLKTGKSFDSETLFRLVQQIVTDHAVALTDGLNGNWVINGVQKHESIGGVCLVMQCDSTNDPTTKDVGVTVDLVPVYIIKTTKMTFNAKAEAFLPHTLTEYAEKGELYGMFRDIRYGVDIDCDTGFIENTIMKQLPEDTKRAFRVAKCLVSHFSVSPGIPFKDITTLDEETRLRLYGRRPWIPSYRLRVLFLHLVLQIHCTEIEQRLKGGLLALCLIDMLMQYRENLNSDFFCWLYSHPLIQGYQERIAFDIPLMPLKIIKRFMTQENLANAVEQCGLLNNESRVYIWVNRRKVRNLESQFFSGK